MTKEKVVELKPKAEKISKEHLEQLQKIVNTINGIQFNIGKVEIQKHNLLHELTRVQEGVSQMRDILMKEYGNDDIDVTSGMINWSKEEDKNEK